MGISCLGTDSAAGKGTPLVGSIEVTCRAALDLVAWLAKKSRHEIKLHVVRGRTMYIALTTKMITYHGPCPLANGRGIAVVTDNKASLSLASVHNPDSSAGKLVSQKRTGLVSMILDGFLPSSEDATPKCETVTSGVRIDENHTILHTLSSAYGTSGHCPTKVVSSFTAWMLCTSC